MIIFCKICMKRPHWISESGSQRRRLESSSRQVKPGPHAAVRHVSILLLFTALTLCYPSFRPTGGKTASRSDIHQSTEGLSPCLLSVCLPLNHNNRSNNRNSCFSSPPLHSSSCQQLVPSNLPSFLQGKPPCGEDLCPLRRSSCANSTH